MKIATIKEFTGMDNNGLWYLEGMKVKKIGGKTVLSPFYYNDYVASEDTTGFTNINIINGGDSIPSLVSSNPNLLIIGRTGYIHCVDAVLLTGNIGLVHTPYKTATTYNDIKVTKNNNILFPNQDYLGIGYKDLVKTGSSTSKIVSTTGNNWETKGVVAGDKVINLTTKEEHAITSISTTNSTNDTLNFTAGGANTANDVFMAFADAGDSGVWGFFSGGEAYPHFAGQEAKANFRRQICKFSSGSTGKYFVGNGNWLAALDIDEDTWNNNYKQLPDQTQFRCMSVNAGNIIVGGECNGKGRLMLWDDWNNGWLSILEIEQVPISASPYKSGFIVLIGTSLYYTDGYNLQFLTRYPDTDTANLVLNDCFNSLKVIEDKVYVTVNVGETGLTRNRSGVAIYEIGVGWTHVPFNADSTTAFNISPLFNTTAGAIMSVMNNGINYIFCGFGGGNTTHNYCLNRIVSGFSYKSSAVCFLPLLSPVNLKKITLGLLPSNNNYASGSAGTISITVSVGSARKQTNRYTQVGAGSTATSIANTSGANFNQRGHVGDEIRILDYTTAGRRSWITAIADEGTASEVWTISPTLTDIPDTNSYISIWPFKKTETRTISVDDIPDNLEFDVRDVYGENLFIEIIISSSYSNSNVDISYIDIYG